MYEFREEATRALTPQSAHPVTEATVAETWTLEHLDVSRSAQVTHVTFKKPQTFGEETASNLREDFAQLADRLVRNSSVLLDFAGIESFGAASLNALGLFKQKLQTKGSRLALCCLDPAARDCFFVNRSP
jgi:anti-anti-sigma regulatory factor